MAKTKGLLDKGINTITQANRIYVGFVSTDNVSSEIIEFVLPHIENALKSALPDYRWKLEFIEQDSEDSSRRPNIHFFEIAHDVLVRRSLDFAFTVTSSELGTGRRTPVSAMASNTFSSAVIPVAYLIRPGSSISQTLENEEETPLLTRRFQNLFFHLFGLLLGLDEDENLTSVMRRLEPGTILDSDLSYTDADKKYIDLALSHIMEGKGHKTAPEVGKLLLYLKALLLRPGQVLKRAWGNKPWMLVGKLHKLVFPAVVAVPLALLSEELWHLGTNIALERIITIGTAIVVGVTVFIVMKQKLLMKMPADGLSERVAVFNLSSIISIVIAVALVLAAIFLCTLAIATGIFPSKIISQWLGVTKLTFGDYAKVSLLIACIASVIGWLGAGFTESDDFRLMLYTNTR
ncbi:MAG: hypothetical protein JXA49_03215 [Actinobacteria bacterium]|nr:hypothetical protein [Actinomycetota bacterium]